MRCIVLVLSLCFATAACALGQGTSTPRVIRKDFFVPAGSGIRLFVRQVITPEAKDAKPILLIHGARVPGLASFDLPVKSGSLAEDLAIRDLDVYVMDVRGYGASTRPREMDEPATEHAALVRSNEAVRDIGTVIDWIREHKGMPQVALFGWATGGQWAGYYASLYPERVSALITLNSLYSGDSKHSLLGHGSDMDDPQHAGRFNQHSCGTYRLNDAKSLLGAWDRSVPTPNKDEWRDPSVVNAYVKEALASDKTSPTRNPPSFRSPCGALEDSFYMATGRQLWDASLITAPTLIVASERDFWSRPEDRERMASHLVHSARVRVVVILGATHFVHLDRPEHGRAQLLKEILDFVTPKCCLRSHSRSGRVSAVAVMNGTSVWEPRK